MIHTENRKPIKYSDIDFDLVRMLDPYKLTEVHIEDDSIVTYINRTYKTSYHVVTFLEASIYTNDRKLITYACKTNKLIYALDTHVAVHGGVYTLGNIDVHESEMSNETIISLQNTLKPSRRYV